MITKIIMPKLSETMEAGNLIKWRKKEGDKVEKGDILFEVETDKAVFENETLKSGYLRKIIISASENNQVQVLTTVGYLADSMDESVPVGEEQGRHALSSASMKKEEFSSKMQKKTEEIPAFKEGVTLKELSRANKIAGERLTLSTTTIPHYYIFQSINMTEAIKLRDQLKSKINEKYSSRLTYTDIIIKALSLALQKFPDINGTYVDGKIKLTNSINIGIAVSAGDELYVPVLKNSQNLNIGLIAKERASLVDSVQDKKLDLSKLSGGTFTLSNLGNSGIESFTAIINPPELAILAVGAIIKEPVIIEDKLTMADVMHVTLSCDHRAVHGAYGAEFLMVFKEILETPYTLLSGGF